MPEFVKKDYGPGSLFKQSSFFIEIDNMLFYTDAIIVQNLVSLIENDEDKDSEWTKLFHKVHERFKSYSFDELCNLVQMKKSLNILMDFVDYKALDDMSRERNNDMIYEMDVWTDMYYSILKTIPFVSAAETPFKLTSIGGGIRIASSDNNAKEIYLCSDGMTEELKNTLGKIFRNAPSVHLLDCNVSVAIQDTPRCSDYFLQSIESIQYIPKGDTRISVCVPGYDYNQVYSKQKEKTLSEDCIKHGIDLYQASVPI